MKKILEPLFIYFSKIYIYFYKEYRDRWTIFPVVILTGLILINAEIASFFILKNTETYQIVILFVGLIILLDYLFKDTSYNYVEKYYLSKSKQMYITIFLIVDLVLCFILLKIARDNYIVT